MRTLRKGVEPDCLDVYQDSTSWDGISTQCKDTVAHQCFDEQNGLCVYCERELDYPEWQKIAHCEHLVPQQTKTRVFDFQNIVLSCNGTPPKCSHEFEAYGKNQDISCGHSRDDKPWMPDLFLHPVDLEKIEQYFIWDLPQQKIKPADPANPHARHMVDLLNLNNPYLRGARSKARGVFRKLMDNPVYSTGALRQLESHKLGFSSFLQAAFDIDPV